ncbi:hypothetical protein HPB47_000709 [Ixodes persulcatus]|uniref:Uncharacterized protein n=1 Tax=Ixodes persulcatus TaxID=34615 RepID=A0AC60PR02_IXOPE|nr:hypothetical protein HPB47_000709 [Ixodes persulcatus]
MQAVELAMVASSRIRDSAQPSCSGRIRGIEGFVVEVVPRYTDIQFKEHFRMYRSTFEVLVQLTDSNVNKTIAAKIPTASKVLMTLWLLGNQVSYREITGRFGVRKSTLHFIVAEVVSVGARHASSMMQWPTQDALVAGHFERKWKFPGVVGAVDGCHGPIKAPKDKQAAYFTRKEFHSVVLRGGLR